MPKGRAKAPVYRLGTGLRRKKAADLMVQIFFFWRLNLADFWVDAGRMVSAGLWTWTN